MVSRELVPNHALRARIAAWRTRGLDPLPARWIPPRAPAPAPAPQQRQPRPTALHLTNERMAVVCQAIHGVLNRAPHLRRRWASPRRRAAPCRGSCCRGRAPSRQAHRCTELPDLQHFAAVLSRAVSGVLGAFEATPSTRLVYARAIEQRHGVAAMASKAIASAAAVDGQASTPRRSTPSSSGPGPGELGPRRRRRRLPNNPFRKASRRASPPPSPCLRERQLDCPRPAAPCGPTTRRPWWRR